MALELLPPWEQIPYFLTPVVSNFSIPGPGSASVRIATNDPNRVVLIISNDSSTAPVYVSPFSAVTATGNGVQLSVNYPKLEVFQASHGSLVNLEWWFNCNAAATVTVLELSMSHWPRGSRGRGKKTIPHSDGSFNFIK